MKLTNKDLHNIIKEELKMFFLETTSNSDQKQKSFMDMRFNTLFETGFDGIFQIIEFAESLDMNMPRVYSYISKKLNDIEYETDIIMEYFGYDYEGLNRLFVNLVENFGDDFFEPRAYRVARRRFDAIKKELDTIDKEGATRDVDSENVNAITYKQTIATPQIRAANHGESIIEDIVEAFEYYAANKQDDSVIGEKKKRKKRKKAGTESSKESSLRDWFGRKGAKGKKKGWVDCNAPDGKGGYKSCGRSTGEKRKKYPACRPTPGACKERGKGKSWGKKAKKRGKKK
jgi:hypothetical protein